MKKSKIKFSFLAAMGLSLIVLMTTESCKKSSSSAPPTYGGYTTSDSVAASNLVAYWPFDGNVNDVKGGVSGTASSSVTYTTGIRGQAYKGAAGAYATVVPSAAFSALPSFSLSVWYNLPAQPANGDPGGMFFLSGTNTGTEMILETEHYAPVSGDSVKIHHGFTNLGSAGWQGFTLESYDTMAVGKWVHLVMTYDGASSTYTYYQNGIPTGVSTAWTGGKYLTPNILYQGNVAPLVPQGNLSFASDLPKQITIGTWPAGVYGVSATLGANGAYLGMMDELRIYNRALSQAEVAGLYLTGLAGK